MDFIKTSLISITLASAAAFSSCNDNSAQILNEQAEKINNTVSTIAKDNPQLISDASAAFVDDKISIDVKLSDSLFMVAQISEPLFYYFTACEVKDNMTKDLETTVNAMSKSDVPMVVTLTDVYGDSHSYEITPAKLRNMIKAPLTQIDYTEAREGLFAALEMSEEQFRPAGEAVKSITTSFKGGFYAYNVDFVKDVSYAGLTTANLKARALKVLQKRYEKLGTLHPVFMKMYKSLGIDGFHLVYTAGEKSKSLKTTVLLSDL